MRRVARATSTAYRGFCVLCRVMPTPERYAVLVVGHVPPAFLEQYGDYATMYQQLLKEGPHEQWDVYKCIENEFPDEPVLDSYRGYVIGGSRHDAHSDLEWIVKLRQLIKTIYERKKSNLLGVCFGHQVIAHSLGGLSGRATGWQVGLQEVTATDAAKSRFPTLPPKLNLLKIHRDQVNKLPPGAELLAKSANTPIEMFSLGDRVLCVQSHPEFNCDIVQRLVETRTKDGSIPPDVAQGAISSMSGRGPEVSELTAVLREFLKTDHSK
ncbi:hypothetical protein PBRA_003369 [Plasmodiophora brassicae]|uniref:Glutamine amidotransferase domain-containing protein n=1 Tax=Plasmodiophora brassicae TaxID=37360 RepID=A0A0G4J8D0_PLABS|nr:hypothetical protein PBRA_003369 [Plasmodiophora brassicae]